MNTNSNFGICFCDYRNGYPESFNLSDFISYVRNLNAVSVIWHESVLSILALNTYISIFIKRNLYWIIFIGNGKEYLSTIFLGALKMVRKDPDYVVWISFVNHGNLCKEDNEQVKAISAICMNLTRL